MRFIYIRFFFSFLCCSFWQKTGVFCLFVGYWCCCCCCFFICFARFTCDSLVPRISLLFYSRSLYSFVSIVCDSEHSSFVLWLQFDNCHPRAFISSFYLSLSRLLPGFIPFFVSIPLTNLNYGIWWHIKQYIKIGHCEKLKITRRKNDKTILCSLMCVYTNDKMNENHHFQLVSWIFSHLTTKHFIYVACGLQKTIMNFNFAFQNKIMDVTLIEVLTSSASAQNDKVYRLRIQNTCIMKWYLCGFIAFAWTFCTLVFALDQFSFWIIPIWVRLTQIPYSIQSTISTYCAYGSHTSRHACAYAYTSFVSVDMA